MSSSGLFLGRSAALLHDLALVGAFLAYGLGIGDQRAVDLDPVTVAHLAVGLHQLGVDAELVAAVELDVGVFLEQTRGLDGLAGGRPFGKSDLDEFLALRQGIDDLDTNHGAHVDAPCPWDGL